VSEHREAAALLPWFVNGTLPEADRRRVEDHLSRCALCSEAYAGERALFARMREADTTVEYLPMASLQRFNTRLSAVRTEQCAPRRAPAPRLRRMPLAVAAAVAAIAVGFGVWTTTGWQRSRTLAPPPLYRTVTTPASRPAEEVIRAVFAPQMTLGELKSLLDAAQLKIVAGPSEAGVYSLAPISALPVDDSLAVLRRQPTVRFAERTRSDAVVTRLP
jgi:anti-sigma factor RsiW